VLAFDEPVAFNQEVTGNIPQPLGSGEMQGAFPECLGGTPHSADAAALCQRACWFEGTGSWAAQVLVDKNPSLTCRCRTLAAGVSELKVLSCTVRRSAALIIQQLFPETRCSRDQYEFSHIERTARHYSDLMDVGCGCVNWRIDWLETHYEDVVKNLESEGRRATEFLGLSLAPRPVRFMKPPAGKFLLAPTYHEVATGISPRHRALGTCMPKPSNPRAKWLPTSQAFG